MSDYQERFTALRQKHPMVAIIWRDTDGTVICTVGHKLNIEEGCWVLTPEIGLPEEGDEPLYDAENLSIVDQSMVLEYFYLYGAIAS
jgi:hypothetical protein